MLGCFFNPNIWVTHIGLFSKNVGSFLKSLGHF